MNFNLKQRRVLLQEDFGLTCNSSPSPCRTLPDFSSLWVWITAKAKQLRKSIDVSFHQCSKENASRSCSQIAFMACPLPLFLSLSRSLFPCNLPPHTHTRSEILSNIFLHNSPHGTNEATFSLKKMRFARFWMQAACKQPFPFPCFSLFSLSLPLPLSHCLLYLSLAYPLTAKTALTSDKLEAGQQQQQLQLIRNSSQSAWSADGAYEQR